MEERARWHTACWLLMGSLVVAGCAFTAGWLDHQEALAFRRSSHLVTGRVIESDCWVLCRGGPIVSVAYENADASPAVGALRGVERHYLVGESVVVVYSDDATSDGNVYVPPAEPYLADGARWWGLGGLATLLMAFAAWALPANLRRLDRRDARHSV